MISFFGASVTLQKDGYAKLLSKKFNDDVKIFGYGGMHINNAGICFIDAVLEVKPSICFIDFFSTVYTIEDQNTKDYIDTIIYKFTKANCKLVFLFFPKKYDNLDQWYLFCKKYLDKKDISYIDVNSKLIDIKKDIFLKDTVHTNNYGSNLYAEIIYNEFEKMKDIISLPKNIIPTKYINIKKLKVEKSFDKKINIKGNVRIIGILNTIGPYSGILSICSDKENSYKVNIWDQWCYYTRKHFNLSFSIKKESELTLLSDNFDTKTCKYNIDFNNYRKKIIIHDIYFIGDKIEISNIKDGKNISKLFLLFLNVKGRLTQLLNKYKKKK
jgi:hypothetical protein